MKYMWKVIIKSPNGKPVKGVNAPEPDVIMFGTAANVNIAISKAKKKLKENLNMKSEGDDLVVVEAVMLHPIEF